MLAFDTCLDKTYVTLSNGKGFKNRIILSTEENYHSAYLISTIVKIFKESVMTPQDLECVATDIGPGSFTGIRACVTVARMLAQQLDIKAVGVSSLEILSRILGGDDLVALDARKNKAYVYDKGVLGAVELEEVDKMIQGRRLITDNSLFERFSQFTDDIVSYQQGEYELGEILAKIAYEKIESSASTSWGELKPLYIQPPPVTIK